MKNLLERIATKITLAYVSPFFEMEWMNERIRSQMIKEWNKQ